MAGSISPRDLKRALHEPGEIALFDVREAGQFGESHLLFATPLPYSRLELDIPALAPRRSVRMVLCDDGETDLAERAAGRLQQLGYTDVTILVGGTRGWSAAGYPLFAGVNVPSKTFGELVEEICHTPHVTAAELMRMKRAGEDFFLVDGRPLAEHHRMTIPGSTCCPNAELPLRIATMVNNPATPIIVNCAGRTRSILGAQTLINFGVPNPVYALENGTQGWLLAGYDLEYGSTRRYPETVGTAPLAAAQAAALRLMQRFDLQTVPPERVGTWLADDSKTTFLCDVRTPEEFERGSLPGARHAPGGQLIQAADQWIGVRNARVVVFDGGEMVRAPVVASWLRQLGYEPWILAGGATAALRCPPVSVAQPAPVETIAPAALREGLHNHRCTAFDLGPSMDYRKSHVPGSRWTTRSRIVRDASSARDPIVLISPDAAVAALAAQELRDAGVTNVRLLDGGKAAWRSAGHELQSSPEQPPDADCIDYLFFVHDRHEGNREAMRQYLAWETGLLARLDAQEKASFRVSAPGPARG